MKNVKLIVIYPRPKDVAAFENIYQTEHVPLAVARLAGKTKMVATKILGSPQGTPLFYRIARNVGPCRKDFLGWIAHYPRSRGRDFHLHKNIERLDFPIS